MSSGLVLVLGCAASSALLRAAGPLALAGRQLPRRLMSVVGLLAPALLAALVVTHTLADDDRLRVGADTAGVAVAGLVAWRTRSPVAAVLVAAAVTAVLRAA